MRNKNTMLHQIAEVSLRSPKWQVETVIDPVVGGVIEALLSASVDGDAETAAANGEPMPDEDALSAVKASAGNVSFATVIAEMSKLQIVREVDLPRDLFAGIAVNVARVAGARSGRVAESSRAFAVSTDSRGRQRVVRIVYECSAALVYINTL